MARKLKRLKHVTLLHGENSHHEKQADELLVVPRGKNDDLFDVVKSGETLTDLGIRLHGSLDGFTKAESIAVVGHEPIGELCSFAPSRCAFAAKTLWITECDMGIRSARVASYGSLLHHDGRSCE